MPLTTNHLIAVSRIEDCYCRIKARGKLNVFKTNFTPKAKNLNSNNQFTSESMSNTKMLSDLDSNAFSNGLAKRKVAPLNDLPAIDEATRNEEQEF